MRVQFVPDKIDRRPADALFISLIIILVGLGLGVLFSASYHRALTVFRDPYYFIRRQILWVTLGTAAAAVASTVSLSFLKRVTPGVVLLSLFLMLLCFVPGVAPRIMGARRWIVVMGQSFQPSELAKVAVILYLAFILQKKQDRLGDVVNSLLPPLLVTLAFAGLTYLQNDFSTAVFLLMLGLSLFFVARVRLRYIFLMFAAALPVGVYLLFSKEHRIRRILSFLEPGRDPVGADYQILAAKNALLKGGFWGTGIGQGTRKLGGLPEAHSDFVFAVLGEELGYLGVVLVVLLFLAFAYRGYAIAGRREDGYGFYLAFGATTCVLFQGQLNMAVVSGLVPATGIPLPFFSSGGSSVFITLVLCGLLVNLSRSSGEADGAAYG
jgi:cell division protein FtsW